MKSLQEAGADLLTFYRYPERQWRALRTMNVINRLNGESRRRTKTQSSFRNEHSALVVLWGLIAFGQVRMRKIDGWQEMPKVVEMLNEAAWTSYAVKPVSETTLRDFHKKRDTTDPSTSRNQRRLLLVSGTLLSDMRLPASSSRITDSQLLGRDADHTFDVARASALDVLKVSFMASTGSVAR